MAVTSVKELFRKSVSELGQPLQLTREFVCVLGDDTLTGSPTSDSEIITALGLNVGSDHPDYVGFYKVRKITLTEGHEGSPYHVHALVEYGVILANELLAPTSRAAVWEFDSAPGQVPALFYYDGTTMKPLTNSAYDYFEGLVTEESLVAVRVTKNFASLPTSWIAAQNCVNDATYLGCPIDSVKVAKVNVKQTSEQHSTGLVHYWQAIAELQYRQSGHNLQLPDVGFNYIDGTQKRRAMVFDFQNGEWVASPNPVGLDGNGAQTLGVPAILNRRVSPRADFSSLFGTPPTTPVA